MHTTTGKDQPNNYRKPYVSDTFRRNKTIMSDDFTKITLSSSIEAGTVNVCFIAQSYVIGGQRKIIECSCCTNSWKEHGRL